MRRRDFLTGAAVLAGVAQANAFGIGKEGARGGFGSGGALGTAGTSTPDFSLIWSPAYLVWDGAYLTWI